MADVLVTPPVDDEIVISLIEQKMVTHETVRISVTVNAQRDLNTDENVMRTAIKAALRTFVDAEWRFLKVIRQRGQTRFENVTVQAIARVPESENVQLFERANAASEPGMEVVQPMATYALPFNDIQKINRELRVALVKQAHAECDVYNATRPGLPPYRVALVQFADTPSYAGGVAGMANNATPMRASSAYAGGAPPSDLGAPDEGSPDLGETERLWVAAEVKLRAGV